MPENTQDVNALVAVVTEGLHHQEYEDCDGYLEPYTEPPAQEYLDALTILADLARKALPEPQEGYDFTNLRAYAERAAANEDDMGEAHLGHDTLAALDALIAANERVRVLEKVAEWLAQHIAGWNKQDHADHGISTWTETESLDYWLAAAHEAVNEK